MFWFLVKVRIKGEDYIVDVEVKKVTSGENVGRRGREYYIKFGGSEVRMSEELTKRIFEILLYMLPEEDVIRMMKGYCERRLKWI